MLNVETKWSTPACGGAKQFEGSALTIRWYTNTSLIIKGQESEEIKNQIVTLIGKNTKERENITKEHDQEEVVYLKNSESMFEGEAPGRL